MLCLGDFSIVLSSVHKATLSRSIYRLTRVIQSCHKSSHSVESGTSSEGNGTTRFSAIHNNLLADLLHPYIHTLGHTQTHRRRQMVSISTATATIKDCLRGRGHNESRLPPIPREVVTGPSLFGAALRPADVLMTLRQMSCATLVDSLETCATIAVMASGGSPG